MYNTSKSKCDEKSWKGILMSYQPTGYKVWDPESEKNVKFRDVIVAKVVKPGENDENSHKETDTVFKSVLTESQNSDRLQKLDQPKSDDNVSPIETRKVNHDVESEPIVNRCSKERIKNNSEIRLSDKIKAMSLISYK